MPTVLLSSVCSVVFSLRQYFQRVLFATTALSLFHMSKHGLFGSRTVHRGCNCGSLYVVADVIKFGDMLHNVSKGIFSVMLTPHKLLQVAFKMFFGCSCTGQTSLYSTCIFDALCVSTCVWVYEVYTVVNCEVIVALVVEAIISSP